MNKLLFFVYVAILAIGHSSCTEQLANKSRGVIVMGDSSTIVTETNPAFLSSNIEDFKPIVEATEQIDSTANEASVVAMPDTVAAAPQHNPPIEAQQQKNRVEKAKEALEVPFQDGAVYITGIKARIGKMDWTRAKSASYTLTEGSLNGQTLTTEMTKVNKVAQRIQTAVLIKLHSGSKVKLPDFSAYSPWQNLKLQNDGYIISGFEPSQLRYEGAFSTATLRKAIQKWSRKNRMNRKEEERILKSIRNVRSAQQAPCSIAWQSVVWKISGVDKNGKPIERELRIDQNL